MNARAGRTIVQLVVGLLHASIQQAVLRVPAMWDMAAVRVPTSMSVQAGRMTARLEGLQPVRIPWAVSLAPAMLATQAAGSRVQTITNVRLVHTTARLWRRVQTLQAALRAPATLATQVVASPAQTSMSARVEHTIAQELGARPVPTRSAALLVLAIWVIRATESRAQTTTSAPAGRTIARRGRRVRPRPVRSNARVPIRQLAPIRQARFRVAAILDLREMGLHARPFCVQTILLVARSMLSVCTIPEHPCVSATLAGLAMASRVLMAMNALTKSVYRQIIARRQQPVRILQAVSLVPAMLATQETVSRVQT